LPNGAKNRPALIGNLQGGNFKKIQKILIGRRSAANNPLRFAYFSRNCLFILLYFAETQIP
jgi:hypothetical protein